MEFNVRAASAGDAAALADFVASLKLFHRLEGLSPETLHRQVGWLLELGLAGDSHSIYLAHDAERRIIGYTNVHWLPYLFLPGPEGWVSELFIAATARGQGVGTELLRIVKEEAKSRGCCRLSLLNMRDRESYERSFYLKDGWEERPDAANFIFNLPPSQRS